MKRVELKKQERGKAVSSFALFAVSAALFYSLISLYFCSHFFFNTKINGVDVSLKAYGAAEDRIRNHLNSYGLRLKERTCKTEKIAGQDIDLHYNEKVGVSGIYHTQKSLQWIASLFRSKNYSVDGLYLYREDLLDREIARLSCFRKIRTEPQSVKFKYSNGSYQVIPEIEGDMLERETFDAAVKECIEKGAEILDLEKAQCYKKPKYTLRSKKTQSTAALLNRYVSANIIYRFGAKNEELDSHTIHQWLSVDDDLNVEIDELGILKYVMELSKKYDTVGAQRTFRTSSGKTIAVKGGLYGWKIDRNAEAEALLKNITRGEKIKKEPVYEQKAVFRGENEIGDTYLEIDLTKQHLWFYRNGTVLTAGPVVTGNPNRGWSTVTGTYMLNYKQKGARLSGPGYETSVTYWMPFYGNIGLHDAVWRSSFGGKIYKRNGTHGCVNAPFYLAKTVYENIEEGTPVICYEEPAC